MLSPDNFGVNQTALRDKPLRLQGGNLLLPLYFPFGTSNFANAALLATPLFDSTDLAVTYGAFGFIIGHELGHGFDSPNARGNIEPPQPAWWIPDELQEFHDRARASSRHTFARKLTVYLPSKSRKNTSLTLSGYSCRTLHSSMRCGDTLVFGSTV